MRTETIHLTPFGKRFLSALAVILFLSIPVYYYVMSPLRNLKKAIATWDTELLVWAAERGANVNQFINDQIPLVAAYQNGKHAFMRTLLDIGATPEIKDEQGVSLASLALQANDTTAFKVLAEGGANLYSKADTLGRHVFSSAAANAKLSQIPLIARYMKIDSIDSNGKAALHYANNPDVAEALVHAGGSIEVRDRTGNTPLHLLNNAHTIAALHNAGANINAINDCGTPALFYQVGRGNGRAYEYLLHNGADMGATDGYGHTVLTYAMMTENELLHRRASENFCEYYPEQCEATKEKIKSAGIKALATVLYTYTAHRAIMSRIAASEAAKGAVRRGVMRGAGKKLFFRMIPFFGWGLTAYDIMKVSEAVSEQNRIVRAHEQEAARLKEERRAAQKILRDQFLTCNYEAPKEP